MDLEQPTISNTPSMIQGILGNPLGPGELGVLLARAGVGKTACLTHIALEQLLRGLPVLRAAPLPGPFRASNVGSLADGVVPGLRVWPSCAVDWPPNVQSSS